MYPGTILNTPPVHSVAPRHNTGVVAVAVICPVTRATITSPVPVHLWIVENTSARGTVSITVTISVANAASVGGGTSRRTEIHQSTGQQIRKLCQQAFRPQPEPPSNPTFSQQMENRASFTVVPRGTHVCPCRFKVSQYQFPEHTTPHRRRGTIQPLMPIRWVLHHQHFDMYQTRVDTYGCVCARSTCAASHNALLSPNASILTFRCTVSDSFKGLRSSSTVHRLDFQLCLDGWPWPGCTAATMQIMGCFRIRDVTDLWHRFDTVA